MLFPLDICVNKKVPPTHSVHWGLNRLNQFFIINPSNLLKVTKFLVEISRFKFLVMTEKNIFILNIFIFNH